VNRVTNNDADKNARHAERMARKKAVIDERIAKADRDKGVVLVNTGNAKGKSSAGFGVVARALGHDMRVAVVQFVKGAFSTGEMKFFQRFPEIEFCVMGEGFTWETQDRERDVAAAQKAWQRAKEFLRNPDIDLVLLDELNIVLKHGYLDVNEVVDTLKHKPEMQHVVITGRAAKQEIIDVADTVTEMREVKHAFKSGIRAQKGMEL